MLAGQPMTVVCPTCHSDTGRPCTFVTGSRAGTTRTTHHTRKHDAHDQYNRLHGPMSNRHDIPADDRWLYQPLRAGDLAGLILGVRRSVASTLFRHPEELGALYEVAIGQEDPELLDHTTNIVILMTLAGVPDRSQAGLENLAARLSARGYLQRFQKGPSRPTLSPPACSRPESCQGRP